MLKPSEARCEQNLKKMEIRVKFTGSAEKRVYLLQSRTIFAVATHMLGFTSRLCEKSCM